MQRPHSYADLPADVLIHVFEALFSKGYLTARECISAVHAMRGVCRRWRQVRWLRIELCRESREWQVLLRRGSVGCCCWHAAACGLGCSRMIWGGWTLLGSQSSSVELLPSSRS